MVSFRKLFSASLFLLMVVSVNSCRHSHPKIDAQEIPLVSETIVTFDSIVPDFNLYPERWGLVGDTLWVVNNRDSLFLHGYDLVRRETICSWGKRGNGPEDFLFPGIIEGGFDGRLGIYSNTGNKVMSFEIIEGQPKRSERGALPLMAERGIPKPYTRLASINDSVVAGTYFLPREAATDIFNVKNGTLYGKIEASVVQPEEHMSGPYEFKIAASVDKIVSAYRYLDCIEFYRITPDFNAVSVCLAGQIKDQNELFEADRDDEMVKYYSDVQCDSRYAYLLFHGVEIKKLEDSPTYLRVYDLESYKNVANVKFDRYFNQLLVDGDGGVILSSPAHEDNLYFVKLDL